MSGKIKLRKYQKSVDDEQKKFMASADTFRAIVNSCTGSGKTVNFFKLIIDYSLSRRDERGEQTKVLIVHPRLALSEDQQKRAHEILPHYGLTYRFATFHTGAPVTSIHERGQRPFQTTKESELKTHRDSCKEDIHITWTSYHSLKNIAHLKYDLIICDEAHYLLQKDFRSNVGAFRKDTKTLFYTATPVGIPGFHSERTTSADPNEEDEDNAGDLVDPKDKGMGEEFKLMEKRDGTKEKREVFGKVIATVPPKDLIPDGFVVSPLIKLMEVETKDRKAKTEVFKDPLSLARIIGKAYRDQLDERLNKNFNHKMLVVMPGVRMFKEIMDNRQIISDEVGENVDVYAVSANWHAKNGRLKSSGSRSALIDDFAATENRAVILHFDTLAEGIDVDGIGGVLFLRKEIRKVKSLQTIGRACRPSKDDIMPNGNVKKRGRKKTHAILTLVKVDKKTISQKLIEQWSIFFEEAGYDKLWAYVPKEKESGFPIKDPKKKDSPSFKKFIIERAWFERLANDRVEQLRLKFGIKKKDP